MTSSTTVTVPVSRIITHIPISYTTVISRIHDSLGSTPRWPPSATPDGSSNSLESIIKPLLGPHGFMLFAQYDFHQLLSAYGEGTGGKLKRVIFGNPLIARTMLKWDVKAGLFAPVSMLVMEREDGTTEVMYDEVSSLVCWEGSVGGEEGEQLRQAAGALSSKMRTFVEYLGEKEESRL